MIKKAARIKRAIKIRKKLYNLAVVRLVVHRTSRHIYAQIISKDNCKVLVAASTTEKFISDKLQQGTSNKIAAAMVGKIIAERAMSMGIVKVSFDRSGFKYHGRIKALADCARQFGLSF